MRAHIPRSCCRPALRLEVLEDRRLLNADGLLASSTLRLLENAAAVSVAPIVAPAHPNLSAVTGTEAAISDRPEPVVVHEPTRRVEFPVNRETALAPTREVIRDELSNSDLPVTKTPAADPKGAGTTNVAPIDPPSVEPKPIDRPERPERPELRPPAMKGAGALPPASLLLSGHPGPAGTLNASRASAGDAAEAGNMPAAAIIVSESQETLEFALPDARPEGLLEASVMALVVGLHDASVRAMEGVGDDAAAVVAESAGLLGQSAPGFQPAFQGAGLAEYIPALQAAALNFAVNHQLLGWDLDDEFFSLLNSLGWKHVAAAGLLATAACLGYQQLRQRRRGLWADPQALLWNPQLAAIPVVED